MMQNQKATSSNLSNLKPSRFQHAMVASIAPIIWGMLPIPYRLIQNHPPEQILFYRIIFSGLLLLVLLVCVRKRNKLKQAYANFKALPTCYRRRNIYLILLSGILLISTWYAYIYVVNKVSVQAAAFSYLIAPLIIAGSGCLLLKERLNYLQWVAITISLISAIFLGYAFLRHAIWSICLASLFSGYILVAKLLQKIEPIILLSMQLLLATLLIMPQVILNPPDLPKDLVFWLTMFVIVVFFTLIPLYSNAYSLTKLTSSAVGIITYMKPIIAFSIAFFYFSEPINSLQIIAYSVLLLAITLFNLPPDFTSYWQSDKKKSEQQS